MDKLADLDPSRYGIELSTGGNILPALAAYKRFPGMEGAAYYYYDIPKNPVNDWLVAEHQKRFNAPPDFFTAGGFAAAMAVVTAVEKAKSTDTEKLISTMEGMPFDTPKGKMIFRKEDHQALQSMYAFKVRVDPKSPVGGARAHARTQDRGHGHPDSQQAMTPSLETRGLTVRFGGHVAVDHVSCAFRPGELTAIVGPNGAGKTTYFNLISGQLRASDGAVLIEGQNVTGLSAPQRTRLGLGRAFQLTNLFPRLSVGENVRLAVQAHAGMHYDMRRPWGASADLIRRADAVLDSVGLSGKREALASALPHGDQRKLEVAMMMALEPRIYMFDEPTAGMSVDEVPVVLDLIARLKTDPSKTILLVEHKMDVVRSLADRIIVLTNGELAADGDPATVIASPVVQEAYLGIAPGKAA